MKPSELKKEFAKILKEKTIFHIDYTKAEYMIDMVFGNDRHTESYNLLESEDFYNEDWKVYIKPESADEDTLQKIFSGEWPVYCTHELMCEMCRRGLIPSGDYLISISL